MATAPPLSSPEITEQHGDSRTITLARAPSRTDLLFFFFFCYRLSRPRGHPVKNRRRVRVRSCRAEWVRGSGADCGASRPRWRRASSLLTCHSRRCWDWWYVAARGSPLTPPSEEKALRMCAFTSERERGEKKLLHVNCMWMGVSLLPLTTLKKQM